jgi:NADPH-dependent curcumin reductase CurA
MKPPNHQIRVAARPSGLPKASDWKLTTEPAPVAGSGEFVVAVEYLSIDPAMRRWISPTRRLRPGANRRRDGGRRDRPDDPLRASRL